MHYLVFLTILLTPTYGLRFSISGLPTNLLMVWFFVVWLVFAGSLIAAKNVSAFFKHALSLEKKCLVLVLTFFTGGLIGLFTFGASQAKLGQFIVLFLQPIISFFVIRYIAAKQPKTKKFIYLGLYTLCAATGLYAILQYLTLFGLPQIYWGNSVEPKRAVSFFGHPNFYALFISPILAFLVADLRSKILDYRKNLYGIAAWIIGSVGLFLSLSRAGWLGLIAAIAVYVIVAADKKIRKAIFSLALAGLIIVAIVPNFRYRLLLPFYGEKSAVSRLSLWTTGAKAIKESPVFGLGLTGFSENWKRLNTDPNLDTHNFPHNIFLNFWVETGLLGLISTIGLMLLVIYRGIKNRQDIIKLSTALFVIAILAQGQIDNPYFKNDLAIIFWLVLALI